MTVGERLREARERQKVSLQAIAVKTNISARFLDAIEKNQFDKLPGGIFTRGFIRSYAAEVGLDPDGTVTQFLSDEPGQRDDDIDVAPARRQGEGLGLGTLALTGLGIVVVALALVYLLKPDWIGLQSAAAPQESLAPAAESTFDSNPALPASSPSAADTPAPPSVGLAPAGAPGTAPAPMTTNVEPALQAPKAPLRLVVTPSGRCWVQVSADGQMRVAREVAPGERLAIDAAERLQIVVGDAGNFAYELNGRPGKALGAAGRVARATILPSTVPQFQTP